MAGRALARARGPAILRRWRNGPTSHMRAGSRPATACTCGRRSWASSVANTPWLNHSWHATFYVDGRGLTTGLVPGVSAGFEVRFDFVDDRLRIDATDGGSAGFALEPMPVARFHDRFVGALAAGRRADRVPRRPERGARSGALPRADRAAAPTIPPPPGTSGGRWSPSRRCCGASAAASSARRRRCICSGAASISRSPAFRGARRRSIPAGSRPCPTRSPGKPIRTRSVPPGSGRAAVGSTRPTFYAYAYPMPEGFAAAQVAPAAAAFNAALGEFLLPYEAVRSAADPEAALMAFLQIDLCRRSRSRRLGSRRAGMRARGAPGAAPRRLTGAGRRPGQPVRDLRPQVAPDLQAESRIGSGTSRSMSRVTPPRMISRRRECP